MARILALVARTLLAALLLAGSAAAEVVDLPNTRATVTLDTTWMPVAAPGLVAAYKTQSGHLLAITRAQVANADAWRDKTRDAYVEQIERGLIAGSEKRVARKLHVLHGVPTLDVELRTRDGATALIRLLLFRTYALSLAIEIPRRADVKVARAALASFTPPPPE
ncbi:MAG: hypothetical protein SFX73_05550 [Kofleriaceae bacterium]|nr:hypothetical protein [Kofleriaceae bacterium]